MSFLTEISEYISNTISKITDGETSARRKGKENKKFNSVVMVKPDEIGDTFTSTNPIRSSQRESGHTIRVSADEMISYISRVENDCKSLGINCNKVMEYCGNKRNNSTTQREYEFFRCSSHSLRRMKKHNAMKNRSINAERIFSQDVKLTTDAIENGVFQDIEDMESFENNQKILDIQENLFDEINKGALSFDEIISHFDNDMKNFYNYQMQEIQKLPEKQRAEATNTLKAKISFVRDRVFTLIEMQYGSEKAAEFIALCDSQNLKKNTELFYEARANAEERKLGAKVYSNFENNETVLRIYHDRGDALSTDEYQGFAIENCSHMDNISRQNYEDGYVNARKRYAVEGYPEYMTEDYFVATAVAIDAGTRINEFMTVEERTAALTNFYQVEQSNFGDADIVHNMANTAVEEYISEHLENRPNLKSEVESINNSVQKEIEKINSQTNASTESKQNSDTERRRDTDEVFAFFAERIINTASRENSKEKEEEEDKPIVTVKDDTIDKMYNLSDESDKGTVTKAQIAIFLETNNNKSIKEIAESFKISENTVLKVISQKGALVDKYTQEFVTFIKQQRKAEDLIELANSSRAIELIIAHNNVENREKLNNELDKKTVSTQKYLLEKDEQQYAIS